MAALSVSVRDLEATAPRARQYTVAKGHTHTVGIQERMSSCQGVQMHTLDHVPRTGSVRVSVEARPLVHELAEEKSRHANCIVLQGHVVRASGGVLLVSHGGLMLRVSHADASQFRPMQTVRTVVDWSTRLTPRSQAGKRRARPGSHPSAEAAASAPATSP